MLLVLMCARLLVCVDRCWLGGDHRGPAKSRPVNRVEHLVKRGGVSSVIVIQQTAKRSLVSDSAMLGCLKLLLQDADLRARCEGYQVNSSEVATLLVA